MMRKLFAFELFEDRAEAELRGTPLDVYLAEDVRALAKEVLPFVLWHYPDKPLDSNTVKLGEKLRAIVDSAESK